MMTVKIGSFGVLTIGHKTMMGKVSQVIEMGNRNRKAKGLEKILLDRILEKQDLWEFIIARNTQILRDSNSRYSRELKNTDFVEVNDLELISIQSDYSSLKNFKTLSGHIRYGELIKQFPTLINSKRGKYGGTYANLYILLKIASMLDKDLEVEIYRVFIEENLLGFRDSGGNEFKELNKLVKMLPNGKGQQDYIKISLAMRKKLSILDTQGYNKKEHTSRVQEKRTEYQKDLQKFIQVGVVRNISELIDVLKKLK